MKNILNYHQQRFPSKRETVNQKCYFSAVALMLLTMAICRYGVSAQTTRVTGKTTNLLGKTQLKQVPIATTVEGTITTPIIWTDNSRSSATKATVILNEPLLYSDGSIALPVGSSLIVEVSDWDDAGFVTLDANAIKYENRKGEFSQHSIHKGTLLIKNQNHQPLEFKKESNSKNSIVSEVANEAVQTGARNLSLPSGLDSVVSRIIRDNFISLRRSKLDAVYSIEEETTVSIYVNSFLSFKD